MSKSLCLVELLKALEVEATQANAKKVRFDSWDELRAARVRGLGWGRDCARAGEVSLYDIDTRLPCYDRRDR